jgi:hypothetical protein
MVMAHNSSIIIFQNIVEWQDNVRGRLTIERSGCPEYMAGVVRNATAGAELCRPAKNRSIMSPEFLGGEERIRQLTS